MNPTIALPLSFALVALAAHRFGRWATALRLPYITGYLAAGALAGSFGLGLLPTEAAADLRWIDEVSLAVIAFVAGSELHLPEIRPRLATVRRMATAVVGMGLLLLIPAVWFVSGFVADDGLGSEGRLAVALLGAIVLLALSPPSTIAVIREARASGGFTSTILSTTIVMDVIVVVLFAAGTSVTAALLHDVGINVAFAVVLLVDLALAVAIGVGLGRALGALVGSRLHRAFLVGGVLLAGYLVHEGASALATWSAASFVAELHLEPLLVCMAAGFVVTNQTSHRAAFDHLLHDISPAVYVAFFALTGLGLKLDVLVEVLPWAVILFGVRLAVLAVGTRIAGATGDDAENLRRWSWMALVTQAGIALGLAREATVQFPELGASFATLIIAVVVLNEVFGPLFLRRALERSGDARVSDAGSVLLYGLDRRALAMADRLGQDGWQVHLADGDHDMVTSVREQGRQVLHLEGDVLAVADRLAENDVTVDVAVLADGDDARNLAVGRALVGRSPDVRIVARASGPDEARAFDELEALVIDHTAAVTGLLEQAVRSPATVALLFPTDEGRQAMEVTIPREWEERDLRELRLPHEVLVLEVRHGASTSTPDGFTRVRANDVLTLLGRPEALREARARLTGGHQRSGRSDQRDRGKAAAPA